MPRPRKPADSLVDRRPARQAKILKLTHSAPAPPKPPAGLLAWTLAYWDAYWASEIARATWPVDRLAVELLFITLDEWRRCQRAFRQQRYVAGSKGQARMNPAADQAARLMGQAVVLMDRLGLSPAARAKLGLAAVKAVSGLEELNRALDARRDSEDRDESDPRFPAGVPPE